MEPQSESVIRMALAEIPQNNVGAKRTVCPASIMGTKCRVALREWTSPWRACSLSAFRTASRASPRASMLRRRLMQPARPRVHESRRMASAGFACQPIGTALQQTARHIPGGAVHVQRIRSGMSNASPRQDASGCPHASPRAWLSPARSTVHRCDREQVILTRAGSPATSRG